MVRRASLILLLLVAPTSQSAVALELLPLNLLVLDINDFDENIVRSPDPAQNDFFGSPVEFDGNWMVVGAVGDDEAAAGAGAAYVYQRVNDVWTLHQKLMASDAEAGDGFGSDVDIIDGWIVVGASLEDELGADAGAAYVFQLDGDMWVQNVKILASGGTGDAGDEFGFTVAIDAAIPAENPGAGVLHDIVIGAPSDEGPGTPRAGRIYIYRLVGGTTWSDFGSFSPDFPDAFSGDEFGFSVDIHQDGIVVGTPEDFTGNPANVHGAAYFFQRRTGQSVWIIEWKFIPSTLDNGSDFGWSTAVEGNGFGTYRVVVGAPQADDWGVGRGSPERLRHRQRRHCLPLPTSGRRHGRDLDGDRESGWQRGHRFLEGRRKCVRLSESPTHLRRCRTPGQFDPVLRRHPLSLGHRRPDLHGRIRIR